MVLLVIGFGVLFGLIALILIESRRALEKAVRRFENHPYLVGLGVETIEAALAGSATIAAMAFLYKIIATTVTFEAGGSGGIVTPLFFIGATSGAVLARLFHLPIGVFAAFGFVSLVAAGANTPIAAAVMGMELLPAHIGVYAALAAVTAFLMVGHRSVFLSQRIGLSKSAGLDVPLEGSIGDLTRSGLHVRKGSITERVTRLARRRPAPKSKEN